MRSNLRTENAIEQFRAWKSASGQNGVEYRKLELLWAKLGAFAERAEILAMIKLARADRRL